MDWILSAVSLGDENTPEIVKPVCDIQSGGHTRTVLRTEGILKQTLINIGRS
jgi:hypothetical protein